MPYQESWLFVFWFLGLFDSDFKYDVISNSACDISNSSYKGYTFN